jgi:hypothetical protein
MFKLIDPIFINLVIPSSPHCGLAFDASFEFPHASFKFHMFGFVVYTSLDLVLESMEVGLNGQIHVAFNSFFMFCLDSHWFKVLST